MTVAEDQQLADAIAACREITRRRARNFYYGLKLSPEPQRSALYTMYAWMRRADDLADVAGTESGADVEVRRGRIEHFRISTEAALAGNPADDDPLWIALPAMIQRFDIQVSDLHAMLDGQLDDLSVRRYDTFEQLREYCYRVASTVGLICVGIWGCDDEGGRDLAVDRGIAFQLTNILRDFRQDYDAGHVYFPREDFERHALTETALRQWSDPVRCERFVLDQAKRAMLYYQRSAPLDDMITPSCRPTLWAMTEIYLRLLRKIRDNPALIAGERRIRLSTLQKGSIALQARRMAHVSAAAAANSHA